MFSHQLYNLIHIVGLVMLMLGLGGLALTAGFPRDRRSIWNGRSAKLFHAFGAFLILLGGFGMMARLGILQGSSWPTWITVKVVVWGALTLAAFLPYRLPKAALPLLLLVPLLAGVAAYMAIYKPF